MQDEHEHKMVYYRTPHSPSIAIHLMGEMYKAENGVLKVPEAASHELDRMAKTRGDVASNFFKLDDIATAEAVAKAHRDANGRPDAISGGVSSTGTIKDAKQPQLDPQPKTPAETQTALSATVETKTAEPTPVITPAPTLQNAPPGLTGLAALRAQGQIKPGAEPVK